MIGCGWSGSPVRACGSMGERAAWQRRAPPGDPLLRGGAPARRAGSRVPQRKQGLPRRPNTQWSRPRRGSPVVFCSGWCRLARISLRARSHERRQVGDVGDAGPRVDAADEQGLDLVEVADAGQVALVEDRDADLLVGVLPEPAQRLVEVPVGAEDVGPEVADQPVLVGRRDDLDVVQPVADAFARRRWPAPRGRRSRARRATSCPAGRCASCRPSGSGCAASARRPAGSAGACRAAPPRGRCCRSGRGRPAGGAGTRRGAASSRPARCSSAARPARRCLPRARLQSPRPGGAHLVSRAV